MATIFPNNPQINDQFQGYFWNGSAWKKISLGLSPSVTVQNALRIEGRKLFVQSTEPENHNSGDIWIKIS